MPDSVAYRTEPIESVPRVRGREADAMKERSLPLPGGCWKVQSIRLHQAREAPMETAYDDRQIVGWTCTGAAACWSG